MHCIFLGDISQLASEKLQVIIVAIALVTTERTGHTAVPDQTRRQKNISIPL